MCRGRLRRSIRDIRKSAGDTPPAHGEKGITMLQIDRWFRWF
jgi:hypothetical protein